MKEAAELRLEDEEVESRDDEKEEGRREEEAEAEAETDAANTRLANVEQGEETAISLLVQLKAQQRIRRYRGKLSWEGDLDSMRRDA